MSDSSIVIIQGTVGLYTVATRCRTCCAVTLKYTEDSSLTEIQQYDTLCYRSRGPEGRNRIIPKCVNNIEKVISKLQFSRSCVKIR